MKISRSIVFVAASLGLVEVTQAQCPAIAVTPDVLTLTSGQDLSLQSFSASPAGTYTFVASGLPAGVGLGANGVLNGAITSDAAATPRIVATDSNGCLSTHVVPVTSSCLSLPVGGVYVGNMPLGSKLCFNANGASTNDEYTLIPMNRSTSVEYTLSVTGTGVVAVSGPPSPRPAEVGELSLAPLQEAPADAHLELAPPPDLSSLLTPERRAQSLLPNSNRGPRPNIIPVGPPTVGQLMDLQVAQGCFGTPDIRKGRVEAISNSPVGQKKLYIVQEVKEDLPTNPGTYIPVIPGGFGTNDFKHIADAYVTPFPAVAPFSTGSGEAGTATDLTFNGGLQSLETNYGALTDLDTNDGVIVFFTSAINQLSPPASSQVVLGLFQARDLFSSAPASCPLSNEGEIVYMLMPDPTGVINSNVRTLSFVAGNTQPTLMHQFSHLDNAARHLYVNSAPGLEEAWLDESLAMLSTEFQFYNTSVGLAPRTKIQLSTLTTGPNASRRVAAFNNFENILFGRARASFFQFNVTGASGRQFGPLRTAPFTAQSNDGNGLYYGATAMFLRYALDRINGVDATVLNAIVNNATQTGVTNLQTAFGANPFDWVRDFQMAMYADDAVVGIDPKYQHPSWNYRSVYGGLGGYPLTTSPLSDGVPDTRAYTYGGGARWVRFGHALGQPGSGVTITEGGATPPSPIDVLVMRTK